MMHVIGVLTANFPYVERIEVWPVKLEADETYSRVIVIHATGCTLKLVLTGPTPEALAFKE
jgi:hypothetical protein